MGTFFICNAEKKPTKRGPFSCVDHRMMETSKTNKIFLSRRKNLRTLIIEHFKCLDWCPFFYWETHLFLINGVWIWNKGVEECGHTRGTF
ncbi:hypothetical protein BAE31_01895 [Bacillus sp. I-2]|nr:hypothetical protein [Bacillus safensis]OMP28896.1 hypothetical protein BAE31_01895 [Bacillus sp. I-2]